MDGKMAEKIDMDKLRKKIRQEDIKGREKTGKGGTRGQMEERDTCL